MKTYSLALLAGLVVSGLSLPALAQPAGGQLSGAVDQQLLDGWKASESNEWLVLRNTSLDQSEQTLLVDDGKVPANGRLTSVRVNISSRIDDAAIGIISRNDKSGDFCLAEVKADARAAAFCVLDGESVPVGVLTDAAALDGGDVLEMIDFPGEAHFFINGQKIGDITYDAPLGGDIGIMAYDKGTFRIAEFEISELSAETEEPSGDTGNGGGDDRMTEIMGPLAGTINAAKGKDGWELFFDKDWLVFVNETEASSENFFTVSVDPVRSGQRVTAVNVAVFPPQGKKARDFQKSAAGILIESSDATSSCIAEITGAGDGLVLCFGADGKSEEIGRLEGAALGDGKDVIALIEWPDGAEFRLNGEVMAELPGDDPALGGEIGVLAYERGEFYFGGFEINEATDTASGGNDQGNDAGAATPADGPMPMFDHDSTRLVGVYLGLTNGIFMHEFGHALIGELQLPSTGPEEDAVDIFSALQVVEPTMFPSDDPQINAIGKEVATYSALQWYYSGMIAEQQGSGSTPWQDEHTADLKRFRNVFCVMYGGNPDLFENLAGEVGFDERTLGRCEEEFAKQNRAWRTILAPHTRVGEWQPEGMLAANAPGAEIEVIFEPSALPVGQFLIDGFSDSLRGFAEDLADTYALPRTLTVTYRDCGELNAWYDPGEASITMCYDLVEYLAVMISDIEMGTDQGYEQTSSTPKTKGGGDKRQDTGGSSSQVVSAIDETEEFGVPQTNVLFPAPYRGPTPASHTKAKLLTTPELVQALDDGGDLMLIDTSGSEQTLPGALSVTDAGKDGSLTDRFQTSVDNWLQEETGGDTDLPLVFFGGGLHDRSSYNAALRAGALGWNAYWYRGGIAAWEANGLPLKPAQ